MLYGTGSRPYPLTVTETAKVLGVSRDTIYRYVKMMNGEKRILKTKDRLVLPELPEDSRFKQFNKVHPITGDPLVTEWIDDLLTRKGGSPLKNWSRRICCLEAYEYGIAANPIIPIANIIKKLVFIFFFS